MIKLTKEILGYPICVTASPAGSDWNITILGGCTPHIGSVSLAEYIDGTVTLRTLQRETHKDKYVSDQFARTLAEQNKCSVCVSCGIHYDNADQKQLQHIIAAAEELLFLLCEQIN